MIAENFVKQIVMDEEMTAILDRIQNVLNQNIFNQSQDLDLLRHDLENHIIEIEELESLVDNNPDDGSWVGR